MKHNVKKTNERRHYTNQKDKEQQTRKRRRIIGDSKHKKD
jgi:hypothetical protein